MKRSSTAAFQSTAPCERAGFDQRLCREVHQLHLEVAAAEPGRRLLQEPGQRAGGDVGRQVVALGQARGGFLLVGVEEVDALAAALDHGAQLVALLGDHVVGRDADRLGVGRQLGVEPGNDLVLGAGLHLLRVDRLGNDGDVDLVVLERGQAGAEIADRHHGHFGRLDAVRLQHREDGALAHRLGPAVDEALALEVLGRVDLLARPRHPEGARPVGAAADDLDREAFLEGAEHRRKGDLGEQRVARHHVAHAGAAALGGQDAGDIDAGLLEVALVERHRIGRAVEQRRIVGDDDILGARGACEAKAERKRSQYRANRFHGRPPVGRSLRGPALLLS